MTKLLEYTDIDGNFGSQTQDAVKSFQQSSNLTADGVVGQATWNALPADPEHAEVSPRVNGQCCIRTAKRAGNIRRCKHSNRSWAYRWGLWPED
jgi:lysozyme family protein